MNMLDLYGAITAEGTWSLILEMSPGLENNYRKIK